MSSRNGELQSLFKRQWGSHPHGHGELRISPGRDNQRAAVWAISLILGRQRCLVHVDDIYDALTLQIRMWVIALKRNTLLCSRSSVSNGSGAELWLLVGLQSRCPLDTVSGRVRAINSPEPSEERDTSLCQCISAHIKSETMWTSK